MVEKLRYLEHHVIRVRYWDKKEMSPEDSAKRYVQGINNPIFSKPKIIYPETPEFYQSGC